MIHELKTWPEFYERVVSGEKAFEIRKNDRGFKVGDILYLREWDNDREAYTGRELFADVTYMTDFAMPDDYVCMSIKPMRLREKSDEKQTGVVK